jgi:hypothetical protein
LETTGQRQNGSGGSRLAVFHGPTAIRDFLNPQNHPFLPLVELPDHLNPFHADGAHILAKLMYPLPLLTIKSLPTLNTITIPPIWPVWRRPQEFCDHPEKVRAMGERGRRCLRVHGASRSLPRYQKQRYDNEVI